jgi:transcriptional regulator with PAS, ATPase and Fis domain
MIAVTEQDILSIKQRFGIIGQSPKLMHALRVAMQVGPTEMTVLITGESGVGKESFSKIIHQLSARKHGQFIAINCGAIPEGTIDSELFGHEKGAFTGAHEARKGYFEVTDGGTIFLDEIGEMPLSTQSRLLRVLENGEFIRVGSSKVQKTNVRVIAATNVNLIDLVTKGKFREDLYYRLNTVPIYVPALRERSDDTLLLFKKFAAETAESYRIKPLSLKPDAQEVLLNYGFPGNIRQLKNLVQQISVLEVKRDLDGPTLSRYLPSPVRNLPTVIGTNGSGEQFSERDILYKVLFDLKKDLSEMKGLVLQILQGDTSGSEILARHQHLFDDSALPTAEPHMTKTLASEPILIDQTEPDEYVEAVEDILHEDEDESLSLEKKEKEMIIRALEKNRNRRKYAAQDLGISERTLYRKIKQYEIEE